MIEHQYKALYEPIRPGMALANRTISRMEAAADARPPSAWPALKCTAAAVAIVAAGAAVLVLLPQRQGGFVPGMDAPGRTSERESAPALLTTAEDATQAQTSIVSSQSGTGETTDNTEPPSTWRTTKVTAKAGEQTSTAPKSSVSPAPTAVWVLGEAYTFVTKTLKDSVGNDLKYDGDIMNWPCPTLYTITSFYAEPDAQRDIRRHTGIDISGIAQGQSVQAADGISGIAQGQPVQAAADGRVAMAVRSDEREGYGNFVVIDHGVNAGGTRIHTLYAYLSDLAVTQGQAVSRGDAVGKVGSTGAAIGPHLHFEVRENSDAVDPLGRGYIKKAS